MTFKYGSSLLSYLSIYVYMCIFIKNLIYPNISIIKSDFVCYSSKSIFEYYRHQFIGSYMLYTIYRVEQYRAGVGLFLVYPIYFRTSCCFREECAASTYPPALVWVIFHPIG